MPEITLSEADLAKIGAKDHADLLDKLKIGYEKGVSAETIANLTTAVAANAEATSKALNKLIEDKDQEAEATRFDALAKSKLFETYMATDEADPEKAKIREHFEKRLGVTDTAILLDGDGLTKSLHAPISKSHTRFDETMAMRKAFDYVMLYCATVQGITVKPYGDKETVVIDKQTLKHACSVLVGQNFEGAELVQKAVDVALDNATAGEGLEWVPAQILSRNLYQDVWLSFNVAGNFQRFAAAGPNFSVPIRTQRARLFAMDQATAVADYFTLKAKASAFATDKVDFTMRKAGIMALTSDELVDDSAVAILEEMYGDLVFGTSQGIERACLNGHRALTGLDNGGTDTNRLWANTVDQNDGIHEATGIADARFLWDGIRQNLVAGTKLASASFGRDELLALRGLMSKYGVNPADLFIVVCPQTYIKMLKFPEVATLEKYGPQATVLKGELARIDNIPIIVSDEVRRDYDNLGTFTNGTVVGGSSGVKNLTQVLIVHKRGYAFADRMTMRIESDRNKFAQQTAIIGTMRLDFKKMFKGTEQTEAALNNVTV